MSTLRRLLILALIPVLLAFPSRPSAQEKPAEPAPEVEPVVAPLQTIFEARFTEKNDRLLVLTGGCNGMVVWSWDTTSGERHPLPILDPTGNTFPRGEITLYDRIAPDGKTIAVLHNGSILVTEIATGRVAGRFLAGKANAFNSRLEYLSSSRLAWITPSGLVRIFDWVEGKEIASLPAILQDTKGPPTIPAVAFSPDGKIVARYRPEEIVIHEVESGKELGLWRSDLGTVSGRPKFAWCPDNQSLLVTNGQGIRRLSVQGEVLNSLNWIHLKGAPTFKTPPGLYAPTLQIPHASRPVFSHQRKPGIGSEVILFEIDLEKGESTVLHKVETDRALHSRICVSGDGRLLAVLGGDRQSLAVLYRLGGEAKAFPLGPRSIPPQQLSWSNDSQQLHWLDEAVPYEKRVSGGVFDPAGPAVRLDPKVKKGDDPGQPAPPPNRVYLSTPKTLKKKTQVEVLEFNPAEKKRTTLGTIDITNIQGTRTGITDSHCLRVGTDRVVLRADLTGTREGGYRWHLFDLNTGGLVRSLPSPVSGQILVPTPDGQRFATIAPGGTIEMRNWDGDKPLLSLVLGGKSWVAWTPEGYYAAGGNGEQLLSWRVPGTGDEPAKYYPASEFRASLHRPDVIREVLKAGSTAKALEAVGKANPRAETRPADVSRVLPPTIRILDPSPRGTLIVEKESLRLKAAIQGKQGVVSAQLLLDGRPYPVDKPAIALKAAPNELVTLSWDVTLPPGVHTLSVAARSPGSESESDPLEVLYQPTVAPMPSRPNLHVLAIGVNAYPKESGQRPLNWAVADATALTDAFKARSAPLFGKVETHLLTDAQATKAGILAKLDDLHKTLAPEDVVVVFYAGHGEADSNGEFYLLPHDTEGKALAKSALAGSDLKRRLATLPARRVLVLLDACRAGAIGNGGVEGLARELRGRDCGVAVVCAAMDAEESLESAGAKHGFFTLALLEGLEGKAPRDAVDGAVYLSMLCGYVERRVEQLSDGRQNPVVGRPTTLRSFPLARP